MSTMMTENHNKDHLCDNIDIIDDFGIDIVLVNTRYGGYGLSKECKEEVKRRRRQACGSDDGTNLRDCDDNGHKGGESDDASYDGEECWGDYFEPERNNPILLQVFEERGSKWCSGKYASLERRVIPAGLYKEYGGCVSIKEYDGKESLDIDFSRAFHDSLEELLSREDATIEDVRNLRMHYKHLEANYEDDAKKKIGTRLLPRIMSKLMKSGLADKIFENELDNEDDVHGLVQLLSNRKDLNVALSRAETSTARLAKHVRDVIVYGEDVLSLLDLLKNDEAEETLDSLICEITEREIVP